MAELRIEGVTKRFGDFTAVSDVRLTIPDQEFMVLLGPSGCGKSTLLRSIAGLEVIDEGNVVIGGNDVTEKQPRHRGISMVFQSYAVFPHLTVFENIAFGLRRQKRPKDEINEKVHQAAELLHIEDLLDRHPAKLSGGQRQRVAVARALAYEADILLMDEPLSNLDALLRIEMRAELKRLLKEVKATVIYVTHDQVEALSMGDRIAVMNEGKILQVGGPLEIYDYPATKFIGGFIGNPPMNFLEVMVSGGLVRFDDSVLGAAPDEIPDGRVLVGIRAENISVHSTEVETTLASKVLVVEPLGSHNLLTVLAKDSLVKVTTRADRPFGPGEQVWLELASDRIRWVDPSTELAYGGAQNPTIPDGATERG